MTLSFILMITSYWLFLTGVVFLAGALISKALVTSPSGADICMVEEKGRCFGEVSSVYIFISVLLTYLANLIHLVFHVSYMTETPLGETFSVLSVFLTKTRYGNLVILRTIILSFLLIVTFITIRRPKRWSVLSGVILSIVLLTSLSMSSHQVQKGYLTLPFMFDVVHIVSISLWIGGVFFIRLCYGFFLRDEGKELWRIFLSMIKRFSNLATYSVYLAGLTGIVLAFIRIKGFSILVDTTYGKTFIAKVFIVSVIFALGGINKFFIIPALSKKSEADWNSLLKVKKHLYRFVTIEAILGMIVLLITSLLTHLSPEG